MLKLLRVFYRKWLGGRIINVDEWQPHETNVGPSFWGHDRPYLDEVTRKKLKDMRLKAPQTVYKLHY